MLLKKLHRLIPHLLLPVLRLLELVLHVLHFVLVRVGERAHSIVELALDRVQLLQDVLLVLGLVIDLRVESLVLEEELFGLFLHLVELLLNLAVDGDELGVRGSELSDGSLGLCVPFNSPGLHSFYRLLQLDGLTLKLL